MRFDSQIKRLLKQGKIQKGEVHLLQVQHGDWCKTLKTGSSADCHCNPFIFDYKDGRLLKP